MLRASSSTRSTVLPTKSSSELVSFSSMSCFSRGRSVTLRCRNKPFRQQPLERLHPLHPQCCRPACSSASSWAVSSRPVEHDHRNVGHRRVRAHLFQQLETGNIRQAQVEHDTIHRLFAQQFQGACTCVSRDDFDIVMVSKAEMLSCSAGLSSTTSRRLPPRLDIGLDLGKRDAHALGRCRLGHEGKRPRAGSVLLVLISVTICTGICRVLAFFFSWLITVQPPACRTRKISSKLATGEVFLGQVQRFLAPAGGDRPDLPHGRGPSGCAHSADRPPPPAPCLRAKVSPVVGNLFDNTFSTGTADGIAGALW